MDDIVTFFRGYFWENGYFINNVTMYLLTRTTAHIFDYLKIFFWKHLSYIHDTDVVSLAE